MKTPKYVGIWIRVSTEDQAQGESPEHHEARCRAYVALRNGWEVRTVYHLEGVSGKSVLEHPEAKRMLADVKNGTITALVFSKLARLARNIRELLDMADYFNDHGADLVSLQESIDTSTPAGRLFYTMIAAMAQWEREEIADRVAVSIPIRAKLGKSIGGQAPFGYQWENGRITLHPEEAPIRKLIYELFIKYKRKKSVVRELNNRGYRTRNGSKFSDTTLTRLLTDPIAKGMRRTNYAKTRGNKQQWDWKPESEWIHVSVPPLVDEELWNECQSILAGQAYQHRQPGPQVSYLLTGYVFCALCNERVYVYRNWAKYCCRKCRTKINMLELDSLFEEQLKRFFYTDQDVVTFLEQSNSFIEDRKQQLATLRKEQDDVQRRLDELMKLRLDGEITKDAFAKYYSPLEEQVQSIEAELPRLEAEIDHLRGQMTSADTFLSAARTLYEQWPTLEFEQKRNIVETITERIVLGEREVSITLSYNPFFVDQDLKRQPIGTD